MLHQSHWSHINSVENQYAAAKTLWSANWMEDWTTNQNYSWWTAFPWIWGLGSALQDLSYLTINQSDVWQLIRKWLSEKQTRLCVFNMTSISQIRGNLAEGHSDHKIHADFQQNKPISSILRLFPCSFATLSPPHMPINSPHWFIRHLQTLGVIYNGQFAYRKVDGGNGAPRGNTCRDTVHTPGLWHCEAAALMPQQE